MDSFFVGWAFRPLIGALKHISGEQLGQHIGVLVSGLVSGMCYTSIIKEEGD